jgi:predicted transcriptional regulator
LISVRQIKAARALLGWSQGDLANKSGISIPTIARLEAVDGELGGRGTTSEAICAALIAAGVAFIDSHNGVIGVTVRSDR